MRVSAPSRVLAALFCLAAIVLPRVAHACPMCFNGKDSNSDAFVYGSLFLMFVPVTAIGSLVYWAYRRFRAAESADSDDATGAIETETSPPGAGVVLQMRAGGVEPRV